MYDDITGGSPAIGKLRRLLPALAADTAPLVVIGEAGAGKHLFAVHIHALSKYKDVHPEVLNFSLLSERDQRIALFGGGPPDLTTTRRSSLENTATVIIKHLNYACSYFQDRLVDSLKRKSVVRAGTNEEHAINCRIIFTLRESPVYLMRGGTLTPLLGNYLDSLKKIYIPPLRKRPDDIPALFEYFCRCYREKFTCMHIPEKINDDVLHRHRWSENVRELKAFIRGQFILDCEHEVGFKEKIELMKILNMLEEGNEFSLADSLEKIEKCIIRRALADPVVPQFKIAQLLGMTDRAIRRKSLK